LRKFNENSDAGHIKCLRGSHLASGPQVPHPCFNLTCYFWSFKSCDCTANKFSYLRTCI